MLSPWAELCPSGEAVSALDKKTDNSHDPVHRHQAPPKHKALTNLS